jgi:hypothetical protein
VVEGGVAGGRGGWREGYIMGDIPCEFRMQDVQRHDR